MYYTETPDQHQNIDKLWIDWVIKGTFSEFSFVLLVKSYVMKAQFAAACLVWLEKSFSKEAK